MRRHRLFTLLIVLLAVPAFAGGRLVLVVGAEGEPEYGRQFAAWADRWATAATAAGLQVERIGPGTPSPTTVPTTEPATSASTDKDRLQAVLAADASADAGSTADPLWLVLIGHGTAEGEAKFNLVGPDVSDGELAAWLKPVRRPVAVLVCASSSGPFLSRLSARGRVIVTAARSGSERQFARFGDALSASVGDPAADLDKDGQTSLLEAFLAAGKRTDAFYAGAGRITTEHALLDDNGDGQGVGGEFFCGTRPVRAAATGAAVDGAEAGRWALVPATQAVLPPELRARRDALETQVEVLRGQKATLSDAEYYARLERLMTELAGVYR